MAYVVCENCGGYYELQKGESPDDFDVCQCGGRLEYKKSLKEPYTSPDHDVSWKNPWFAGFISLIFPGLGHIYAGSYIKGFAGIIIFLGWILRNLFYPPPYPWPAFVPGAVELVIYLFIALDAVRSAKNINKINFDSENVNPDILICPECSSENAKNSKSCFKCGRDLSKTRFYVKGNISFYTSSDIELTSTNMIEYQKRFYGKRSGKITEYPLEEMGDILISDRYQRWSSPFSFPYMNVDFDYGDRRKTVYIPESTISHFVEILDDLNVPYQISI